MRNWLESRVGTVTRLQCRGRKKISFVWGIEVELVLVWGPKLTFFLRGSKFSLFLCARISSGWFKLTWFQCGVLTLSWFQCRMNSRRLLCGLFKMTLFQCGGSALICFLCNGRKRPVFIVRIDISWVFESGDWNRLDIGVGIKIDLISVMGPKLNLGLCAGSKLRWF